MIGQVINNFEILRPLGKGGMGSVFEARDQMLDRRVAVKVVRPELGADEALKQRFQQEAQALAKLHHPNITSVFSFFDDGNQLYLVMELVEGMSLQRRLRQGGAMSWREAVELAISALDGLAHAHKNGIVHRDIKPSNLMLMPEGGLKLMDFGISHILGKSRMTREGSVVGTLAYMAPEQITSREVDPRTDLYAMGIVLYEMVTGQTPFRAESDYELMRAQVESAPESPRALSPGLPAWLELRIVRSLAKNPAHRPQSAEELAGELRRGLADALGDDDTLAAAPTEALLPPGFAGSAADATEAATILTDTAPQPAFTPPPPPGAAVAAPAAGAQAAGAQVAAPTGGSTLQPQSDVFAPLPPLKKKRKMLSPLLMVGGVVAFLVVGVILLVAFLAYLGASAEDETAGDGTDPSATTALPDSTAVQPIAGSAGFVGSPTAGGTATGDPLDPDAPPTGRELPHGLPRETTPPHRPRPVDTDITKDTTPRADDGVLTAHKGPGQPTRIPDPAPPTTTPGPPPTGSPSPGRADQLLLDTGMIARQLPDELESFCEAWEDHLDAVEDRGAVNLNKADHQLEEQLDQLRDEVVDLRRAFNVVATREGLIDSSGMLGRFRRMGNATRETVWERTEQVVATGRRSSELLGLAAATDPTLRGAWSPIQSQLYELERLSREAGSR